MDSASIEEAIGEGEDADLHQHHHQFIIAAAAANNLSSNSSSSSSTLLQSLWYRHDVYVGTALLVAYSLVFIAGLIGNFLVVFAVFSCGTAGAGGGAASRTSMRQSTTNIFLANLAIADLLVILACLPFTLVAHIIYRKPTANHYVYIYKDNLL